MADIWPCESLTCAALRLRFESLAFEIRCALNDQEAEADAVELSRLGRRVVERLRRKRGVAAEGLAEIME